MALYSYGAEVGGVLGALAGIQPWLSIVVALYG